MGRESPYEMSERLKSDILANSLRRQLELQAKRNRVALWMEANSRVWIPVAVLLAIALLAVAK